MSQPKVYNPAGDVFTRWLMANPPGPGRGNTNAVNSAPKDTAALAEHFIDMALRDLRDGWPACLIDAVASGITLGALSRAVTVIARRLHGVSVDPKSGQVIGVLDAPGQTPPQMTKPRPPKTLSPGYSRASRLSRDEVLQIRAMHTRGVDRDVIAAEYGIPKHTVSRICNGNCFREVK